MFSSIALPNCTVLSSSPVDNCVLTTWEIVFRNKSSCIKAYRSDKNETMERNCIDKRITWTPRPDQNPALQINPVALTHDGYRMCTLAMPDGNFQHHYHLFVLMNTLLSVLVDTKALLSCRPIPLTTLVLATWKIIFRDNTSCTRAYRKDTHETVETNCTDKGITWASSPDQNPALQIEPVAVTHDGHYVCDMVTSEGNFMHGYHLQVLVPPKTTILLTEHRTVVCKAVAGKPAAQISWTPEGDCVTKQEDQGNDIVSVQSTCHWEEGNVSAVTCSVSHLTGNRSLSLDLHRDLLVIEGFGYFRGQVVAGFANIREPRQRRPAVLGQELLHCSFNPGKTEPNPPAENSVGKMKCSWDLSSVHFQYSCF
ncbi:cell surface glycoprotein CD200 receptor 2-like [Dugong dugon]